MSVAKPALTDAIQDYLREIYKLGAGGARVSVTALAKRQGVAPASASAMVKKLAALGLALIWVFAAAAATVAAMRKAAVIPTRFMAFLAIRSYASRGVKV